MKVLGDVFVGRSNNLTLIRLIAAFAVIYGHASAITVYASPDWVARTTGYAFAGGVAVDLFFMISGFLVTASIINSGWKKYCISRGLRIFPALWVNLFLITFVLGSLLTTLPLQQYLTSAETWNYFIGLATTTRGAFFLPGVFTENHNQAINGSIWSVLLEVWLYVVILCLYLIGILRSKAVFNCVFFIGLVVFWQGTSWAPAVLQNATNLHVFMMFFIGSFLYINRFDVPVSVFYFLIALMVAAATLGTTKFAYAYAILIVTFFTTFSFSSNFSFLDKYGDYSYGVYLYGWPMQQVTVYLFPNLAGFFHFLVSASFSFFLAFLSWHLIEKRCLKFKSKFIK